MQWSVFDGHADSLLEVADRGRDLPVANYAKGAVRAQAVLSISPRSSSCRATTAAGSIL